MPETLDVKYDAAMAHRLGVEIFRAVVRESKAEFNGQIVTMIRGQETIEACLYVIALVSQRAPAVQKHGLEVVGNKISSRFRELYAVLAEENAADKVFDAVMDTSGEPL